MGQSYRILPGQMCTWLKWFAPTGSTPDLCYQNKVIQTPSCHVSSRRLKWHCRLSSLFLLEFLDPQSVTVDCSDWAWWALNTDTLEHTYWTQVPAVRSLVTFSADYYLKWSILNSWSTKWKERNKKKGKGKKEIKQKKGKYCRRSHQFC